MKLVVPFLSSVFSYAEMFLLMSLLMVTDRFLRSGFFKAERFCFAFTRALDVVTYLDSLSSSN